MKPFLVASVLITFGMVYWAISAEDAGSQVEVAVLNSANWDRFVPHGKEVDAIYGDVVLRNRFLTAVIAEPLATRHANMTVRNVGGCLIDMTARQNQSDQLACYYPGGKASRFRNLSLQVEQSEPIATAPGIERHGSAASVVVTSQGDEKTPAAEVRYALGQNDRFLTITSIYKNNGKSPLTISLADDLRADGKKEEMAKSPNGTSDLYWIEDAYWRQAYGVRSPDRTLRANTDGNNGAIAYIDGAGENKVELAPGQSLKFERRMTCGATLAHVSANLAEPSAQPVQDVNLRLQDGLRRGIDYARISVWQGDKQLASGRANADGEINLPLPKGDYKIHLLSDGKPRDQAALHVGEAAHQTLMIVFAGYTPGTVNITVVDEDQKPLPCKVQFIGQGDTPSPHFGPETAAFGVRNVHYTPDGNFVEDLPAGTYEVIVSRGPEYEIIRQTVNIEAGQKSDIRGTLKRTVKTPGWVSTDFHSHSSPSGDNTSSQLGRVLNLVCEQVEFAPCTEHNRITTYQPHFDRLGIQPWISSVTGMELTGSPLPLNHQNVFPLHHHPHLQDGGAPQPDDDVEIQVQRASAWDNGSEKLVQQNHPDIGWLFYDRNGDGQHDAGHPAAVALLDVMEIHPIEDVLKLHADDEISARNAKANRIFHWLQLINQGYRIPGVVNTDAHYNFHGSGGLRNWVQSPTDDPDKIVPLDIVHAAEEGRVVISNGPYLSVTAHAGEASVTAGQDLSAPDGKVELEIGVQTPSWFDIDTVFILVNGRVRRDLVFKRQSHPSLFGEAPVRFQQRIPVSLSEDAHLLVVTGATESLLGPAMGPVTGKLGPAALANPVFVDVDGGGFRPNKDTLGRPLPVKGD